MEIFELIARYNAVNTANGYHVLSYSYVEKGVNGNEHLNLNLE